MAQTPIKIPYGRALMSAPLLNGLAGCALSVTAMAAVLQALAELRHRAGPFDELRTKIITTNQEKDADGNLLYEDANGKGSKDGDKGRPMVTPKGMKKLGELEAQDLDLYCRTLPANAFDGAKTIQGQDLIITGREMAVMGWFIAGAELPKGDEIPPPAMPFVAPDEPAEAPVAEAPATQAAPVAEAPAGAQTPG